MNSLFSVAHYTIILCNFLFSTHLRARKVCIEYFRNSSRKIYIKPPTPMNTHTITCISGGDI
jgi:hypothetical protein